ncbi:MAG: BatA domain-containing protein [Allomuricauda sp.]
MQFKHPEILWSLFLLLIPILIHLFQLRRFKKTPFTNVAMLQKVVAESRKSNTLKKWLLLITRLLLLASLIIAFAQPFSASTTALKTKETVVYLDDSFSMQAKNNGLTLLTKAVQDLIKNVDGETNFSLFTNENTYRDVTIKDVQNTLLSLPFSYRQLTLEEIQLKANSLFSKSKVTTKNLIILSDFQQSMEPINNVQDSSENLFLVPIRSGENRNIAIDSVHLQDDLAEQATLLVMLSGGRDKENLPISLYNGETLIAKTSANFQSSGKASVAFSIPAHQEINGQVRINDTGLAYDNQFFFNINTKEKIKVLAISDTDTDYLERLYPEDEFVFVKYPINQLDYSALDSQNVVLLDNLKTIPTGLQKVLRTFKENGGTVIVIPAAQSNLGSYNPFLSNFEATRLVENVVSDERITSISFQHPLYRGVFEKEVSNFQYPHTEQHFRIQSRAPRILSLESNDPFLIGMDGFYLFTASLETENSNFKNSPLIVPTFYNMATSSLKNSDLYHTLGQVTVVDIPIALGNDQILKVSKQGYGFIPLQQTFHNKVRLTFDENPTMDGIFTVEREGLGLRNISFNYPRTESKLSYMDLERLESANTQDSVASLFEYLEAEGNIAAYWKWFVILALLLALTEVIIQKFVT